MYKKAFTMLELIIVLVVVGILTGVILPRLERDPLREGTNQVIRSLQYTQHLAMNNDIYNASDPTWFKERWQMKFSKTVGSGSKWSCTIYSDRLNQDGVPNISEIALNPIDHNRKLTGGYSATTIAFGESDSTAEMNIGNTYKILDVDFLGGCASGDGRKWISFDHIGRPYYRGAHLLDTPTMDGLQDRRILSQCQIVLCTVADCTMATAEEKRVIVIEPETGYIHLL